MSEMYDEAPETAAEPRTDDLSAERPDRPEPTGHEAVDAVVASLDALDDQPVADHVAVFEQAHESLRRSLADAGEGVPGRG